MGPMRSRSTCLSLIPRSLLLHPGSIPVSAGCWLSWAWHRLCAPRDWPLLLSMLEVLQQAWCRPPKLLCSCLCLRLQSPFGKQLPHQLHQLSRAPSWPSKMWHCCGCGVGQLPTVATPQTKPAISNNQRKVSSCCCLGALRPLLSSVLPSSVGVLHLTSWTRGEDMRGRVSQEEGRSGDAGGAQLGTERVSSLETPSCPGSAQAFRGNRSALAALTNPMDNWA